MKALKNMGLEELQELHDKLALERTEIREKQVAVDAEIDIRRALSTLPPEAQKVIQVRMEGSLGADGEVVGKVN